MLRALRCWIVCVCACTPLEALTPNLRPPAGRSGRPHKRLMWLDITDPADPLLLWQEGSVKALERVKDKDKMRLVEIIDIRAGRVGKVLERSGLDSDADKYISFSCPRGEATSLDIELPTPEAREFVF